MSFASLSASLKLNIQDFSTKLNQASRQMSNFAASLDRDYGRANAALKSHNLGLKDTARIVQGIVISQAFYTAANAITNATRSLWDFNVALDYMHVTYSALFGSTKVASDFMSVLQEHSIETIFDYQSLADASKKLLAYGIEYENLMFIMEGLTNLGTMSGDSAALDRIALALGQIYTKGKLSAEEMRQLANAYIPITEILQDKFGLTGDDLKRVGDLNLPAADVINAIVDYANENFGSVGDAAMYTITGLQNRIVDTLKVVGSQMLKPLTAAYKSFLAYISNGLEVLRGEFEAGGIGGIFEYLVPDKQTQQTIRQFIANVANLFKSLVSIGVVAGQVFGNFASVFATAFNIAAPLVVGLTNALATLLNAMLDTRTGATLLRVALVTAAGAFVILRVQALAALVVTAVTKAIAGLSKALLLLATIITKHPILSLLAALAITLVGVSTVSNKANESIGGLFDTLTGAGGMSSGDVLQRVEQGLGDSASAADQFGNRLENAAQSAEDLKNAIGGVGKEADKAAKKTGGLLSFDEVFKLPDDKASSSGGGAGAGSGLLDALDNLANFGGIGDLGDALIPEIPDFSDFFNGFTDSLFGGLTDSIKEKAAAAGIGSLIGTVLGAIIGFAFKNPALGAKIGAGAGGLVGVIVDALEGTINNAGTGAFIGIAAAIAKAFSSSGGIVQALKVMLQSGTIDDFFKAFVGIFAKTGAKALSKGSIAGFAVGLIADGLAHLLWSAMDESIAGFSKDDAKIGQTIGGLIGTIVGGILGSVFPVIGTIAGSAIGSVLGTLVGGIIGGFFDPIVDFFRPENNPVTAWLADTISAIFSWVGEAAKAFAGWAGKTAVVFAGWFVETFERFRDWKSNTLGGFISWVTSTIKSISDWWAETVAIFSDWDSLTGDTLSDWWSNTVSGFSGWVSDTLTDLALWFSDSVLGLSEWYDDTLSYFTPWWRETKTGFSAWVSNVLLSIRTWGSNVIAVIADWYVRTKQSVVQWVTSTVQSFEGFATDAYKVLAGFVASAILAIADGLADMALNITTKLVGIITDWTNRWNTLRNNFSTWWTNLGKDTSTWLENSIWKPISSFLNIDVFWKRLKSLLDAIKRKISGWWDDVREMFTIDNIASNISDTIQNNTGIKIPLGGHATGGVFNREHVARFAEGNKAEAVIPLENAGAMQPFVDAVAGGLTSYLAPLVAGSSSGGSNSLPPLYVGTLIADDRGLRELYKKFEIIQVQENDRRGTPNTPALV